jgi:pSer/pThr/pTyr-binding forkhead associated (FHA) protein
MIQKFLLQTDGGVQIPVTELVRIGRQKTHEICVRDRLVSRFHATVRLEQDRIVLRDEGSSNGTYVNEKRITHPTPLQHGDQIRVGNTVLQVLAIQVDERAAPISPAGQVGVPPKASQARKKKWMPWLVGLGVLAVLALCVVVVLGGFGLYRYLDQAPNPTAAVTGGTEGTTDPGVSPTATSPGTPTVQEFEAGFNFNQVQSVAADADGSFHYDENGVGLAVPENAVTAEQTTQMVSNQLGEDLTRMLEEQYEITSLAYNVFASGEQDGIGSPTLTFPVSSPDARLAVVIDNTYVAMLAVEPQDGFLTVEPFLGAQNPAASWNPETVESHANQYLVLEPKSSAVNPKSWAATGKGAGAGLLQLFTGLRNSLGLLRENDRLYECGDWWHTYCKRNASGSVFLMYDKYTMLAYPLLDTIATIEKIMGRYKELGFTAANLSPSNPVYVVIGSSGPQYSSKTGNLYIQWGTVNKILSAGEQAAMAHELAHWIQDESFAMTLDATSGPDTWWHEIAAENMVFLFHAPHQEHNLTFYGKVSDNGGRFSFQLSPFDWDSNDQARYIHAQFLKIGLCNDTSVCPLSQEAFVNAVNRGHYVFRRGDLVSRYYNNLPNVAYYLLGHSPPAGNVAVPLQPAAKTGDGYGEYVLVRRKGTSTIFDHLSYPPQFTKGDNEVQIQAQIAHGAAYPLRVSNSGTGFGVQVPGKAGHPAFLEIEPGAQYLYTIDNGPPVIETGESKRFIAPIHDTMGIQLARLVGIAPDAPATLNAKVGLVDLSGDWVNEAIKITSVSSTCETDDEGTNDLPQDFFLNIFAAYGTFTKDPADKTGTKLIWENTEPLPEDFGNIGLQASAEMGMEEIKINYLINIPKSTSGHVLPEILVAQIKPGANQNIWSWVLLAPALGVILKSASLKEKRILLLSLVLIGMTLSLSSCDLTLDLYGDLRGEYTFKKLTYADENFSAEREGPDIWRLSEGKGTITADITLIVGTSEEEPEEERCKTTFSVDGDLLIKEDGAFSATDLNFEEE